MCGIRDEHRLPCSCARQGREGRWRERHDGFDARLDAIQLERPTQFFSAAEKLKTTLHFEHEPIRWDETDTRRKPIRARGESLQQLPLACEVSRTGFEIGNECERRRHAHAPSNAETLRPLAGGHDVLRLPLQLDDGARCLPRGLLKRLDLEPGQMNAHPQLTRLESERLLGWRRRQRERADFRGVRSGVRSIARSAGAAFPRPDEAGANGTRAHHKLPVYESDRLGCEGMTRPCVGPCVE